MIFGDFINSVMKIRSDFPINKVAQTRLWKQEAIREKKVRDQVDRKIAIEEKSKNEIDHFHIFGLV